MSWPQSLTIHVRNEEGQDLWAEVDELPGCFATGRDLNELREALNEAVSLYLSERLKLVISFTHETADDPMEQR